MRKRIIAFLLVAVIAVGFAPLISIAEDGDTATALRGGYTYALSADPGTGTPPAEFGTIANNGRIWTDKSVRVNGDAFDVDLQVLAQEYISTTGTGESRSIAADVLMIFDMTTSMTYSLTGAANRLDGLVDAANIAIDIITNANPNNRVNVYGYGGNSGTATVHNILPLAHYTSSNTAEDPQDKYLVYDNNKIKLSTTLEKDGVAYSPSTNTFGEVQGTGTQYGIAESTRRFLENINNETYDGLPRKPYVILMTDGEPTWVGKKWYADDPDELRTNTITSRSGGDKNELMALATILTASRCRNIIQEAYDSYNGVHDTDDVEWFNIGLGITEPTDPATASYTACMLNPYYLVDAEPVKKADGGTTPEVIKYYLNNQTAWTTEYPYTDYDYTDDDQYTYVHEGDGYVTFANTYAVLSNAFETLAQIIEQGSMEYTVPIVNHEGSGEANSDVVFTDVIGQGMFVDGVTLTQNGKDPVEGVDDDGDGVYTFRGYQTTVAITEDANGQQTLVWSLPANEVAMFTFADRENVTNGEYIPAEPTKLTARVDFTDEVGNGPAYTNAFNGDTPLTTVTYEIPGDNDYYFDVTTDQLSNFESGSLKQNLDSETQKTENTTGSCTDSHTYAYTAVNDGTIDASAVVNGTLGNNGKVTFLSYDMDIDITAVKRWEDSLGNEITDTSSLPPVTMYLYRTTQNSSEKEFVTAADATAANGYSVTWTVPREDGNKNYYTYSVEEEPVDGYILTQTPTPLYNSDGTITLTNRQIPEEGLISVRKRWVDRLGASMNGSSALQPVDVKLCRHVKEKTPSKYTVTITVKGSGNTTYTYPPFEVKPDTTLSFRVFVFIRKQNTAQNARFTLNGNNINSSYDGNHRPAGVTSGTYHGRITGTQTFTVSGDLNLNYVCSAALNATYVTTQDPYNVENLTYTPPDENSGDERKYDEDYEEVTLSASNNWNAVFEDLPTGETKDGKIYTYKYYVEEITEVPGFTASYSANNTEGVEGGVLTVTNTSTSAIPPLPETGGEGTAKILTTGGVTAMLATAFMLMSTAYTCRKKRRKTRDI